MVRRAASLFLVLPLLTGPSGASSAGTHPTLPAVISPDASAEPNAAVPSAGPAGAGTWRWPVLGAVVRPFEPPEGPYGPGHRGIDIAARVGTTVVAPSVGVVSFAASVGGQLYVTIDHGEGVLSTCSFVSALLVGKGALVSAGTPIALSGTGHPGSTLPPHLHFGVRVLGEYVDPTPFLQPASVVDLIRLAPLDGS
jgi:murein DD-endopeptidase MepM/ murein hydrolase activator NlpD